MNDIRIFTKHIDKIAADAVDVGQQTQTPSITVSGLIQQKKRADKLVDELYSFDSRFREIIDRKRTIRTLKPEEETALDEFSQKRSKIMTDLKTEIKNIETHPLIKFTFCEAKTPNVVSPGILQNPAEVATASDNVADGLSETFATPRSGIFTKSASPKNTTRSKPAKSYSTTTNGEKKEKKPKSSGKKETKADNKVEKQTKLLVKELEKEKEKQAKLLEKEREKQAKLLEKEREKQAKLLEKEREKQAKLLVKEREKHSRKK